MFEENKKLELLYRASRDGDTGAQFHSASDNKGATVTMVMAKGKKFRGYLDSSWNQSGQWVAGSGCFINLC